MVNISRLSTYIVAVFTLVGHDFGTIWLSAITSGRSKIIAAWNDESITLHVFIANVNDMGTGVNMHLLLQGYVLFFHLLKVKDTYHDNMERLCITKWISQLSAEIDLPSWLQFELREICICEAVKAYWHQPFNRYASVAQYEKSGANLEYHSDQTIKLGHAFSMVAISIINKTDESQKKFWLENLTFIIEACRRYVKKFDTVGQLERVLKKEAEAISKMVVDDFNAIMSTLRKESERNKDFAKEQEEDRLPVLWPGRLQCHHEHASQRIGAEY
ncbi:hypothetical protein BGZ63DRAFT_423512 [Mariannaea sp. PMI_226]|nr:hypothetical protein BGZ63DRAFT_423512 [Mariannaea sp. PMI_226]